MTVAKFLCTIAGCERTYSTVGSRKRHESTHLSVRRYACKLVGCSKTYTTVSARNRHQSTHLFEKQHVCEFDKCGKRFQRKQSLVEHKRIHTGECPYVCQLCDAKFSLPTSLRSHNIYRHSSTKSFVCEVEECDRAFYNKADLKKHALYHGDPSFSCKYCGKTFHLPEKLKVHERIHTQGKIHQCDYDGCKVSFVQAGNLEKHKLLHQGIKSHQCPECDTSFARLQHLNGHRISWHTKEGQVRLKKEESRVLRLLQNHRFNFKEQHVIDFTCVGKDREGSRAYIDFLVEIQDSASGQHGFIFLEVDEDQHKAYSLSCEVRRMTDVFRSLVLEGNTLPVAFLGYNPNGFSTDEKVQAVRKTVREAKLVETLREWKFTKDFEIGYMYFDKTEDTLEIHNDPEYDGTVKLIARSIT